jgi:molybdopterin synthase sulfur carrier subunit
MAMIKVLFFAQLRDLAGVDSISLECPASTTARELIRSQVGTLPKALTDALLYDVAMVSVNKKMANWDDDIHAGDEVAFLPPFSGG